MNIIVSISNKNENVNQTLSRLSDLGVTGIRINLAKYLNKSQQKELYDLLNAVKQYKNLKCIFDLPAPKKKIRIVEMVESAIFAEKGDRFIIKKHQGKMPKNRFEILIDEMNISCVDESIIYADGMGTFKIETQNKNEIIVKAENPVWLYAGKSFNSKPIYNMNNEQLYSLCNQINKQNKQSYFALSFSEEVKDIEYITNKLGCKPDQIICKIETQIGVDNVEELLSHCSGVLLGRGDLLYYSNINQYYRNCFELQKYCLIHNKDFYLCTDILMSLLENKIPKRAELTDVAVFKHKGCKNYILPAGFSRNGNLREAIKIIKEI